MKVMKFGGTSVGSVESLLNLRNIVKAEQRPVVVVVVSAMGGFTNQLLDMCEQAQLLAHGQQLVGETTHGRNDDHDRPLLGVHNILEVKQALDATHRGTPKFHHFHYCPLFSVISLIH